MVTTPRGVSPLDLRKYCRDIDREIRRMVMLQKLSDILESVKKTAIYVLTPLLIVGGYIYYLLTKVNSLKSELDKSKVEKDLVVTLEKKQESEYEAKQSELDYNRVRDLYLEQHRDSGKNN